MGRIGGPRPNRERAGRDPPRRRARHRRRACPDEALPENDRPRRSRRSRICARDRVFHPGTRRCIARERTGRPTRNHRGMTAALQFAHTCPRPGRPHALNRTPAAVMLGHVAVAARGSIGGCSETGGDPPSARPALPPPSREPGHPGGRRPPAAVGNTADRPGRRAAVGIPNASPLYLIAVVGVAVVSARPPRSGRPSPRSCCTTRCSSSRATRWPSTTRPNG